MSGNRTKFEDFPIPKPRDWVGYMNVIYELGPQPFISQEEADRILRKLCANGVIQSIRFHEDGIEFIPSAEWKRPDFDTDLVLLNSNDLERHTMELQKRRLPEAGKQPRIKALLSEMFPKGVPDPAHCPRKTLKADLLKRDPGLNPLDEATLKSAIDAYNSSLR
jgi:hypothetical protein